MTTESLTFDLACWYVMDEATIAAAQEAGTPSRKDSRVDAHNNEVGQAYGTEHAADLRPLTPGEAMASLVPVALAKWESDELVWVR